MMMDIGEFEDGDVMESSSDQLRLMHLFDDRLHDLVSKMARHAEKGDWDPDVFLALVQSVLIQRAGIALAKLERMGPPRCDEDVSRIVMQAFFRARAKARAHFAAKAN
jgi:hypothetical protein